MKIIFQKMFFMLLFFSQIVTAEGFIAKTLVFTPRGYEPIEKLCINDLVFCFSDTKQLSQKPVTFIKKKVVPCHALVVIDNICIGMDAKQKMYSQAQNKWVEVGKLSIDEHIIVGDYTTKKIKNIVWIEEPTEVYCITVADYHNFCVSIHNIHTHNFVPIALGFSFAFGLGGIELSAITGGLAVGGLLFDFSRRKNRAKNEEFETHISVQVTSQGKKPEGCFEEQHTKQKPDGCFEEKNTNEVKSGCIRLENNDTYNGHVFPIAEKTSDTILTCKKDDNVETQRNVNDEENMIPITSVGVVNRTEEIINHETPKKLYPLNKGSTAKPEGQSRIEPRDLQEQLLMEEIMADPDKGFPLDLGKGMTDYRWPQKDGWVKKGWQNNEKMRWEVSKETWKCKKMKHIQVHYVAQEVNGVIKAIDDFKIKDENMTKI